MEAAKETEFSTKIAYIGDEDDARTYSRIAQRKRAIPHSMIKTHRNIVTSILTALCNQSEA